MARCMQVRPGCFQPGCHHQAARSDLIASECLRVVTSCEYGRVSEAEKLSAQRARTRVVECKGTFSGPFKCSAMKCK